MSPTATLDDETVVRDVLQVADELFYARGIGAVSMADIRDGSGVSLRRLYRFTPSKSDLVARWLEYRHSTWMAGFVRQIEVRLAAGDSVTDAVFFALEAWMVETDFRGCGFINTHAESVGLTEEHRSIIQDHKKALSTHLCSLTPSGMELAVLVDGAIVQASIFGNSEPIELARRIASTIHSEEAS